MEFPTIDEIAKEVAEKAFDEFTYEGKTIREWVEIIAKQQPCEDAPSVSRKKGKWIKVGEWSRGFGMGEVYGWFYECSECSEQVKNGYGGCSYNYCPYCGSNNGEEADE